MADNLTAAHLRAAARSLREKNKDIVWEVITSDPPAWFTTPDKCERAHTLAEGFYVTYQKTGRHVCAACGQEVDGA